LASRKLYQRKWRKANPDYNKGKLKLAQRHCKECNVEVGRGKHRCPECMIIHRRAKAKEHYKYTPEMAARLKRWREANTDKCKVYAQKNYQQRYCKRCNVEVGKMKRYCPECLSIKQGEQKKRHNLEQTEYRKERYENRDKDAYNAYYRDYFRKNRRKILEYQSMYQKDLRENQKQNWYKSRLERIEKLKGYLEMNK